MTPNPAIPLPFPSAPPVPSPPRRSRAALVPFLLGLSLGAVPRLVRRIRHRRLASPPSPAPRRPASGAIAPPPGSLDCVVCLGEFLLPRVAPCGHTLCTPCFVSLAGHERRVACPVCRKRIRVSVEKLPVNFAVKGLVDARVAGQSERAWEEYCLAEDVARAELEMCGGVERSRGWGGRLRVGWHWIKWGVIIATELGAFLVSLKEVVEAGGRGAGGGGVGRGRRHYQRIV